MFPSTAPTYHFHNMSMLDERPEDVLDACQTDLQHDLVAALTIASALPESKVIAQEMESLTFTNGLFWTKDGKMWVPDDKDLRYQVFLDCHASVLAGHMGRDKTDDQIKRYFYWRGMSQDVVEFVQQCHICQLHKGRQHAKYGLLQPLAIPSRPFWSISLDLISGLPLTPQGFDAIITVVDRFTKMVTLIPCKMAISGVEVAKLFLQIWFSW
jgi:hypothetical protein